MSDKSWSQLLAENKDDPRYQAAFDRHVEDQTARWMGLAALVGELNANHLYKFLTVTVDTDELGLRDITGLLYRVQHEQRTRMKRVTTIEVRIGKTFRTFEIPGDRRCVMETPYEESVRKAEHE